VLAVVGIVLVRGHGRLDQGYPPMAPESSDR
jgi:hypothetical protein